MNNQEFFTAALLHCRVQGIASIDNTGNCKYRSPNGVSCAVGGVLTDEEVQQADDATGEGIEGKPASLVMIHVPRLADVDRDLANEIQRAHDHLMPAPAFLTDEEIFDLPNPSLFGFAERSLANFDTKMREIAKEYELTYTEA